MARKNSKPIKIIVRDKKGRFARPHKQRFLSVEVYRGKDRVHKTPYKKNLTKKSVKFIELHYKAPEVKPCEDIISVRARRSLHDTLKPFSRKLASYHYVDIRLSGGGITEPVIEILRLNISDRATIKSAVAGKGYSKGDMREQKPWELIRQMIKFELMKLGYAVTPKNVRTGFGKRELKTVKPLIEVCGYKEEEKK